jgi:hypothetical protein
MLGVFGPKSRKIGVYKGAFIYQGPFKEDFCAGSPAINEVVLGTGVKIAFAAAHVHGFGVARQGPWVTSVNKLPLQSWAALDTRSGRLRPLAPFGQPCA